MKNIGSLWLEAAQLQQQDSLTKICALAALEVSLSKNIYVDAFEVVWSGNIVGNFAAIQAIRRCLIRSMSVEALLGTAGVDAVVLADFIKSLRKEG